MALICQESAQHPATAGISSKRFLTNTNTDSGLFNLGAKFPTAFDFKVRKFPTFKVELQQQEGGRHPHREELQDCQSEGRQGLPVWVSLPFNYSLA